MFHSCKMPIRACFFLLATVLLTACGGTETTTVVVSEATPAVFFSHSVAFRNNTAVAWGHNRNGQLGSTNGEEDGPIKVAGGSVTNMDGVAVGGTHTVVFQNMSGGAVKAWGNNYWGQVGDGTSTSPQPTPVQVKRADGAFLTGVKAVSAGLAHTLALRRDGTVWVWGNNGYGQLGPGGSGSSNTLSAIQVTGLPADVVGVAAGSVHNLALDSSGKVWSWGEDRTGQLGRNATLEGKPDLTTKSTPGLVDIPAGVQIIAIAAGGRTSLAIDSDHNVWGWGYNKYGQAGQTPTIPADLVDPVVLQPTMIAGVSSITRISAGLDHCLALRSDGVVFAWGYNGYGQLGDGNAVPAYNEAAYFIPQQIKMDDIVGTVIDISAIGLHSLATTSDGRVWAWGMNAYRQLGDGTTTTRSVPQVVNTF